eukprot:scaffold886_cov174-Ochromonas_danica.AAC.17
MELCYDGVILTETPNDGVFEVVRSKARLDWMSDSCLTSSGWASNVSCEMPGYSLQIIPCHV